MDQKRKMKHIRNINTLRRPKSEIPFSIKQNIYFWWTCIFKPIHMPKRALYKIPNQSHVSKEFFEKNIQKIISKNILKQITYKKSFYKQKHLKQKDNEKNILRKFLVKNLVKIFKVRKIRKNPLKSLFYFSH